VLEHLLNIPTYSDPAAGESGCYWAIQYPGGTGCTNFSYLIDVIREHILPHEQDGTWSISSGYGRDEEANGELDGGCVEMWRAEFVWYTRDCESLAMMIAVTLLMLEQCGRR